MCFAYSGLWIVLIRALKDVWLMIYSGSMILVMSGSIIVDEAKL
ncbi:hypothetical protein L1279_001543 [Planomicrobium sp. HSC-17F08]|nr:hypothetical protein [Planomicrobium sp. HSC-17F08]